MADTGCMCCHCFAAIADMIKTVQYNVDFFDQNENRVEPVGILAAECLMAAFMIVYLDKVVKAVCNCRKLKETGRVASFLRVRCRRSWRPFCWGCPGWMRSIWIPRRSHQTESRLNPNRAWGRRRGCHCRYGWHQAVRRF